MNYVMEMLSADYTCSHRLLLFRNGNWLIFSGVRISEQLSTHPRNRHRILPESDSSDLSFTTWQDSYSDVNTLFILFNPFSFHITGIADGELSWAISLPRWATSYRCIHWRCFRLSSTDAGEFWGGGETSRVTVIRGWVAHSHPCWTIQITR